ncbi:MAG TPA: ligase-associated DNA damage response DEXH box helicase [Saprospiraceae bacterium]|nr:ligase-associated DNA damage response DEXH box helicase [Saprospiraceae bacterium]
MKDLSSAFQWFNQSGWNAFPFQTEAWAAYLEGYSGLVNAPTGSGKTYSLLVPAIIEFQQQKPNDGLQVIWVTPIRALAKEIKLSAQRALDKMACSWKISIRNGDTSHEERQSIWTQRPQLLITTPESLHVMMCDRRHEAFFSTTKTVIIDEWHELVGSKRGVQTELFLSRIKSLSPHLKIWGISATIGNLEEAVDILLGYPKPQKWRIIQSGLEKSIELITLIPDEIDNFPWSGHLGLKMTSQVHSVIKNSNSTLVFTNTRAQSEIWYRQLLQFDPGLSGLMAMHHGSLSRDIRDWVEDALYDGRLKAVVCTSSLDLGVDFRPVESIIQIGSPKNVSRLIQRAGRSGHQPGAISKIYFVPTHSLELVEASSLRSAIQRNSIEERIPFIRSFDVLIQYLMTLAVSGGFEGESTFHEVQSTYAFQSISWEEWNQIIGYLTQGSHVLSAYDEYKKIGMHEGKYKVHNRAIVRRHKLSIGTIVSEGMLNVQYVNGKKLGQVEEWFLSQLMPGEVFWFAGQALELVRLKEMTAQVRKSSGLNGKIPSYLGGRIPLSFEMSTILREKLHLFKKGITEDLEMQALSSLFKIQEERSHIPDMNDLLIEYFQTREGYHLIIYPFEGRQVHEGIGALLARRIANMLPITFSIAMNDYGFEMLSDRALPVESMITPDLFSTRNLQMDIQASINAVEMARRRFRDIAQISGLLFHGYPGSPKKERHLQSSSQLLFNVFHDYDPDNLLYLQTYDEVMTFQLEEQRLRNALHRIQNQNIVLKRLESVSPLAFPIIVDRLREKMSTEKLEDRIEKMKLLRLK